MKKRYIDQNGRIPTFHIQNELEEFAKVGREYPSSRMVRTKKGKKAIAALIDLEKNHNHNLYTEIVNRAKRYPDSVALFYRGTEVTYRELVKKVDDMSKFLAEAGIVMGDEIPVCMTNTPEFVYLLIAANKVGAKLNIFGEQFDHDYIRKILEGCTKKVFFGDDSKYDAIKDVIQESNIQTKVISSLSDSLPEDPSKTKGYEEKLEEYYHYPNKVPEYIAEDNRIISYQQAQRIGEESSREVESVGDLETDFLVTYTSGSTINGWPKAIIHRNRSLIVSARFHDCELSGNPDMKALRCLAHIPTESNTDIIACITDILSQGWIVCLEPEYGLDSILDVVMLNKPNYLNVTKSHAVALIKQYLFGGKFKNRLLDFIFTMFAVGEGTCPGEEKFINKGLRVGKAGSAVSIKGFRLPFTTLGIAGGSCEQGAVYYTLWKSFTEIKTRLQGVRECGMFPEAYVCATALKPDGMGGYEECKYGEMGLLVTNSYSNMSGYKDNPEATNDMLIEDNRGRVWFSGKVYGYIDKLGGVHIKGREDVYSHGKLPLFRVEEMVTKDTKKVLSCQVVEHDTRLIAIVQFQYGINKEKGIKSIRGRLRNLAGAEIADEIEIQVIPFSESYPLTHSGKRKIGYDKEKIKELTAGGRSLKLVG